MHAHRRARCTHTGRPFYPVDVCYLGVPVVIITRQHLQIGPAQPSQLIGPATDITFITTGRPRGRSKQAMVPASRRNLGVASSATTTHCWWLTVLGLVVYLTTSNTLQPVQAYPPNFHNQTGCLYSYIEGGTYLINIPERAESPSGILKQPAYEDGTKCLDPLKHEGALVVQFSPNDNNIESMTIEFQIKSSPSEGYWEVSNAILKVVAGNKHAIPADPINLKPLDMYAGEKFSYSCNSLVLQNLHFKPDAPSFKITLNRFQLQPFAELEKFVFAPSYDCSVWLTMPVIMGLILILFIVFTVLLGVYLLMEQGNQTSDLRFSKQGGMLMNQAQLDATKG